MRGATAGLASPAPFLTRLPGVLQEDEFLSRFLPAFDDAVAPAISTLDNLAAYLRPDLAPADFVGWLAGWVAIDVDASWTDAQLRRIVTEAVALHRRAGTAGGIVDAVRSIVGPDLMVEVVETGGCDWSLTAGGPIPGDARPEVVVRISGAGGDKLRPRIERVLSAFVPAHVPWRLEDDDTGPAPGSGTKEAS